MTEAVRAVAPEPPAELVKLIHEVVVGHGFDEWQHGLSKAILAAISGRIVQPGHVSVPVEYLRGSGHNRDGESIMLVPRDHVAVPVDDLRLAISSVQTVPRLNALLRLREIANGR